VRRDLQFHHLGRQEPQAPARKSRRWKRRRHRDQPLFGRLVEQSRGGRAARLAGECAHHPAGGEVGAGAGDGARRHLHRLRDLAIGQPRSRRAGVGLQHNAGAHQMVRRPGAGVELASKRGALCGGQSDNVLFAGHRFLLGASRVANRHRTAAAPIGQIALDALLSEVEGPLARRQPSFVSSFRPAWRNLLS
jgi:hypothetical protein